MGRWTIAQPLEFDWTMRVPSSAEFSRRVLPDGRPEQASVVAFALDASGGSARFFLAAEARALAHGRFLGRRRDRIDLEESLHHFRVAAPDFLAKAHQQPLDLAAGEVVAYR